MTKKTLIDAADVMRAAVFRVDDRWYDAYWYREHSTPKSRLLARFVRSLRKMRAAAGAPHAGSAAPQDAPAMHPPHGQDVASAGGIDLHRPRFAPNVPDIPS